MFGTGDITEVSSLLADINTMTIATSGAAAGLAAAPVYFVSDEDLHLYFFSSLKSEHGRNIVNTPAVAVAIYPQCIGWRDIQGVQLKGNAYPVKDAARWNFVWELYQEKFPFVKRFKYLTKLEQLFEFIPSWVRLVDNRKSFGSKNEWTL